MIARASAILLALSACSQYDLCTELHDVPVVKVDVHGNVHRLDNEAQCFTCAAGREPECRACRHWVYDGIGYRCSDK